MSDTRRHPTGDTRRISTTGSKRGHSDTRRLSGDTVRISSADMRRATGDTGRTARRESPAGSPRSTARKNNAYGIGVSISGAIIAAVGFLRKHFGSAANSVKEFFGAGGNYKRLYILTGAVFAVAAIWFGIWYFTNVNASEVYLNEVKIGIIKGTTLTAENITTQVKAKLEKDNGSEVQILQTVTIKKLHAPKNKMISPESVVSAISSVAEYKIKAATITIGDLYMCTVISEEEAYKIKDNLIAAYVQPDLNITEKDTVEPFVVNAVYVDKSEIISSDKAYEMMNKSMDTTRTYVTKSGDSYWGIAIENSITLAELQSLNPGLDISKTLSVGVTLNLKASKPFVSIRTVETTKYIEVEPKKTEYQNNPSQPTTFSRVIRQGKDGQREVTVEIERVNGFETNKTIIGKVITEQPVNDLVEIGTKQ